MFMDNGQSNVCEVGDFLVIFSFGIKVVFFEKLGLFISSVDDIDCVMCRPRDKPFTPLWTMTKGNN
jgi:hypothetical protein